jgi:hypothetical protein
MKSALWIALLGLLAFTARCHNVRETLIRGQFYFVDGDCYARMTRARIVQQHPGTIIRHHDFENYPQGVRSHTTAPLDYAILALAEALKLTAPLWGMLPGGAELRRDVLDLAGALISPLVGALTCVYLGCWARWGLKLPQDPRWAHVLAATPLLFAISPVLVHAGLLGRPDHQAPVIFWLAVAISAELALLQGGSEKCARGWAAAAGVGWGMSFWITLYEPPLLFLGVLGMLALLDWPSFRRRERLVEGGVLLGFLLLIVLIEGSPIPRLDPEVKEYFPRWSLTVGELRHLDLRGSLLYRWLGAACLAAPVLLFFAGRKWDRRAWLLLALLLGTFGATWMHMRWGYFLALVFALALPWLLAPLRRRWLAWLCFAASLWPMAYEWEGLLFPDPEWLGTRQRERVLLRDVAGRMSGEGAFLAPWWLSPAVAYWSGHPGVAGSSHQGLPGIVDSARFYLAEKAEPAAAILERRRIGYVIVDEPQRLVDTSAPLLGVAPPERFLGETLYRAPHSGPAFLVLRYANAYYKLFEVDPAALHP